MKFCSINYKIIPQKDAKISINERGFLFGDGIFETCKISNHQIENYDLHLKRLKKGLEAIKIKFDVSKLKENITQLITKNSQENGLARIYISRGNGSIGYAPQKNIDPLIIIQTKSLPPRPKEAVKLCISQYTKPSINSLPTNYKIAQGLNSTLVKLESQDKGCFDAILLNEEGFICETSSANIFWKIENKIYTPSKETGCLLGVTRQKIIQEFDVVEIKAKLEDLKQINEMFITNVSYGKLQAKLVLQQ